MKLEVAVGYYEGDLKVWDTVYLTAPAGFNPDNTLQLLQMLLAQEPQWSTETIAFVVCIWESEDEEADEEEQASGNIETSAPTE